MLVILIESQQSFLNSTHQLCSTFSILPVFLPTSTSVEDLGKLESIQLPPSHLSKPANLLYCSLITYSYDCQCRDYVRR